MKKIIKERNMNKTTQELSDLYDFLYQEGCDILKESNPCKFNKHGKCEEMKKGYTDGCCIGCEHLFTKGCNVKALSCKLWLCSYSEKENSKLFLRLKVLSIVHWENHLNGFRLSKEQIFEYLNIGE